MQYPAALAPATWKPVRAHCLYVFGNDLGLAKALDTVKAQYAAIDWNVIDPDVVRGQAQRQGSATIRKALESVSGGAASKSVAMLTKNLAQVARIAGTVRTCIGAKIVRHSKVLRATAQVLDEIVDSCAVLRDDAEALLNEAKFELDMILETQEQRELGVGKGPAFAAAPPAALGLEPGNRAALVRRKVALKKAKYLISKPFEVQVSADWVSDNDIRHKTVVDAMEKTAAAALKAMIGDMDAAVAAFDKRFSEAVTKGTFKSADDAKALVQEAGQTLADILADFRADVTAAVRADIKKDKTIAIKLPPAKVQVTVTGAVVPPTLGSTASAAIAASQVSASGSVSGSPGEVIDTKVTLNALQAVDGAASLLAGWARSFETLVASEAQSEQRLHRAFEALKDHAARVEAAESGKRKARVPVEDLKKQLAKALDECRSAKKAHETHLKRMEAEVGQAQRRITDLEKSRAAAQRKLTEQKAALGKLKGGDAKTEAARKQAEKQIATLEAQLPKVSTQITNMTATRKKTEAALSEKRAFHAALEQMMKAVEKNRPADPGKAQKALTKSSGLSASLTPMFSAAVQVDKNTASLFAAAGKFVKSLRG